MFQVIFSADFRQWLKKLRDERALYKITARIQRFEDGNMGDIKSVGEGIYEARIDYGPGYRLYFIHRDHAIIVMLAGGDKSSQPRDINKAKALAQQWRKE